MRIFVYPNIIILQVRRVPVGSSSMPSQERSGEIMKDIDILANYGIILIVATT